MSRPTSSDAQTTPSLHLDRLTAAYVASSYPTQSFLNRIIRRDLSYDITDSVGKGGKRNRLRPSVCIRLFSLYLPNRLTFDTELLHVYRRWQVKTKKVKGEGEGQVQGYG